MIFSHSHADGGCYVCVCCACTHLCVCESVRVCVCVCVCVCVRHTFESGRFGPRGDDKAIKLYVSHINCFDLFSSQTHGSMATRDILPNWKECSSPQNMRKWQARKLTVVSVCPLKGQNTPLYSLVFMLCQFPKRHLKNLEHLFQHFVSWKKIEFTYDNRRCDCGNKMLLSITNSCYNKQTGQQC